MSKPRTQAEIDAWAANDYANAMVKNDMEQPWPEQHPSAERGTDGRSIQLDYRGYYTRKGTV